MTSSTISPLQLRRSHGFGFWVVAFAFATVMAFTTVSTPLWSLYAQRDRFSSLTVTIAFAVYALAVALRSSPAWCSWSGPRCHPGVSAAHRRCTAGAQLPASRVQEGAG